MSKLGSIKGAPSLKYGVFFCKKGEYELKKNFKSPEEALEARKQAIVDLLAAAVLCWYFLIFKKKKAETEIK